MTKHPDRGTDSGEALTEVRTVLSRARKALEKLEEYGPLEWPPRADVPDYATRADNRFDDPDLADMVQALKETVGRLRRWEKTGRTTRSTCL